MNLEGKYILDTMKELGSETFWYDEENDILICENTDDTACLGDIENMFTDTRTYKIVISETSGEIIAIDLIDETIRCLTN